MSMAPTAYPLFHKWLQHDPSDPNWVARDRFVLSMGHSSLTLYIQLFLAGYGLELEDLQALRTWGSQTPGHPEVDHTPGVETTTGPLGQGVGNAVGMAMAARCERGLLDPDAPEGQSLFDHTIWASPPTATSRRASAARRPRWPARSSSATSSSSTTTTRSRSRTTRPSPSPRTSASATRPTAGTSSTSTTARTSPRSTPRSPPPRPRPAGPRSSCSARSSAGPRRTSRTPAPRTARPSARTRSGHQGGARLRPGRRPSRWTTRC